MVLELPAGLTDECIKEMLPGILADLDVRMPAAYQLYSQKKRTDMSVIHARTSGANQVNAFKRNVMKRPRVYAGERWRDAIQNLKKELEKLNLTFEDLGTSEKALRKFIQDQQPS